MAGERRNDSKVTARLAASGSVPIFHSILHNHTLRPMTATDLEAIIRIDAQAFGAERLRMIEEFARIGSVAVIERENVIQDFAFCRPFGLGQAIGPVIARSAERARAHLRSGKPVLRWRQLQ